MTYPQYRKYHNGLNYFKIISAEELEELQFVGDKCFIHVLKAKILPDRNFIYDLTFDFEKMGVEISEEAYEKVRKNCKG